MRPLPSSSSRGQILIATAAGLLVLFGIAALVIDLGFSWMLRRQEQNAADPAAIAAARYLKDDLGNASWSQGLAEMDACFYAKENGFFEDDPGCGVAFTDGKLQVHAPPISGPYASIGGHVQVIIRESHPSFFARIWNGADPIVQSSAVAANTSGNSNTASLVALQTECSGGSAGDVDGGGELNIFPVNPGDIGGYVHVNSPCGSSEDDVCSNGVGAGALSVSGTLRAPSVNSVGSCTEQGAAIGVICDPPPAPPETGCVDEDAPIMGDPLYGLPEPHLDAFPNGVCPNGSPSTPSSTQPCKLKGVGTTCPAVDGIRTCTLTPGVYYGGFDIEGVRVRLQPGMYILAGGGISLSGGDPVLEAVESPTGIEARITIFSTDGPGCPSIPRQCQDDISFQAKESFRAKALNAATCGLVTPQACPWSGILLWQDATASNGDATVSLGGSASSVLAGTIYAPAAHVQITGGTDTTGCTGPVDDQACLSIQIISWTWSITGTAIVDMPYDPNELYRPDNRGLVH